MKSNFLFPNRYKKVGWLLFVPGLLLGVLYLLYESGISVFDARVFALSAEDFLSDRTFFSFLENNLLDEAASLLLIVGALLIAFSKEKVEDEFIAKIRLESLVWATYVNYGILILAILLVYDISFLWVLVFNMFTLLTFFLVRFNWSLRSAQNQLVHEE